MAVDAGQPPSLVPVDRPVSLIPVGLKEAALDSPTFRATVVHYCDQVELVERWLDSFSKSASRLAQQVLALEGVVNPFLISARPPSQLSEAIIDNDYTMVAVSRYSAASREFWAHAIGGFKKTQQSVIDPIKTFLQTEFRHFKDARRQLDAAQRSYDGLALRYYGQSKTKEASALREDAWQLHEAKKIYLKASMDFCVATPLLCASLDTLLIKVFSDHWLEMKDLRETETAIFSSHAPEIEAVRAWSKTMNESDKYLKRELLATRKEIEERAELAGRPSREIDDYSALLTPASRAPPTRARSPSISISGSGSKQGWLFMRIVSGKPARTSWVRRWCYVKSGVFGWLAQGVKPGGVEESEKIGVLLCNVRAANTEDRRFCFEIKTKDASLLLQAESQNDMQLWLTTFETAKQKALEMPDTVEALAGSGNPSFDAAIAVSPAVAPELAAKRPDGRIATLNEEAPSALQVAETDASVPRPSIDLAGLQRVGSDPSEAGRDQPAKIVPKFDIHRKSVAVPQTTTGTPTPSATLSTPSGGLAGLISATQSTLQSVSGRPKASSLGEENAPVPAPDFSGALAPATLIQPPSPTNLSKTVIMIGAEKGIDLGIVDASGGVPSSLMANQWGMANYGHISRIERGEISRSKKPTPTPGSPRLFYRSITPPQQNSGGLPDQNPDIVETSSSATPAAARGHRKTLSDTDGMKSGTSTGSYQPLFYPQDLVIQDTQLRMLFPNVPASDKVVMVFRASWTVDEHHVLSGRAYATQNDLYFYSNHMGFVLVLGMSLSKVLDISVDSSGYEDALHMRLAGRSSHQEFIPVTVTVHLEPLKLLHQRLVFLISNAKLEQPASLKEVLQALTSMRDHARERSQSTDSWQNISPIRSSYPLQNRGPGVKPRIRVDRRLFGGDSTMSHDSEGPVKFKLPTHPVEYAPKDVTNLAAEAVFDVSAKALFHIMFGDKSLVSGMLYFHRRTKFVKQHPWITIDQSHWTRSFEYHIAAQDHQRKMGKVLIVDSQTIEVANDHLCYVVTDKKSPWHLPHPTFFCLITKLVITHVAKSKAKLAIFTKVEWLREPKILRKSIEQHALNDLHLDAVDIIGLVTDQVTKLGAKCPTKRAIAIFGGIGQQLEPKQITAPDPSVMDSSRVRIVQTRTWLSMFSGSLISLAASAASTIVMSVLGTLKLATKSLQAHYILAVLLLVSMISQLMTSTEMAQGWWADRAAASYMARMGVGPNTIMGKAVYLQDLHDITNPTGVLAVGNSTNQCTTTFHHLLVTADPSSPFPSQFQLTPGTPNTQNPSSSHPYSSPATLRTAHRLHRTRQRLATHRHDLLVGLRLVNGLERETVRAQYETWVLREDARCRKAEEVLMRAGGIGAASGKDAVRNRTGGDKGADGVVGEMVLAQRLEEVRSWWEGYCSDCKAELDGLGLDR